MPSKVTSLYIPELRRKISIRIEEQHWNDWQKFLEIAKREGRSPGSIMFDHMVEYVRLHTPGNPQQLLPPLLNGEKPYRALVCERCHKPAKRLTEAIFKSGKTLKECDRCFNHAKEHGLVRRVLRVIM